MFEADSNEKLVDINDISIDSSLPQNERIIEFLRQIKNPYKFKCGKYTITARYRKNGPTIEDCFISMIT